MLFKASDNSNMHYASYFLIKGVIRFYQKRLFKFNFNDDIKVYHICILQNYTS